MATEPSRKFSFASEAWSKIPIKAFGFGNRGKNSIFLRKLANNRYEIREILKSSYSIIVGATTIYNIFKEGIGTQL